ncbi:MAG: HD domain-containing protein [Coriobacteriia bacterium]|nr:HD domain-containing protein [Coriobacteriia bacterium]
MSEHAVRVVSALSAARRAVQLYPPSHPKFAEATAGLVGVVRDATSSGPFVLNLHQGRLYVRSVVLPDDGPAVSSMAEAFEARELESLTLHPGFGEPDALALTEVLSLRPAPELDLEAELASRGAANVSVARLADEDAEAREERDRLRRQDRALYRQLVGVLRTVSAELGRGASPDLANAGMLVSNILGRLSEDEAAVLALATMNGHGETDLFHSVNVMIYALTLGGALGLPDEGLTSLGISALLHDIGKAAFDRTDPEQAARSRLLHPGVGAEVLARMPEEDKAPMLVAYEHHMAPDGSGWPDRGAGYVPHPFSRMVAVADRYEHLTKPNGGTEAVTPDRAVMQLIAEAGHTVDSLFARLFVRALGIFPVGCLVRLSDHSAGVVCGAGPDPLNPRVRLLFDPDGAQLAEPPEVELAEEDRTIVEVVHPDSLDLNVSEHL